MIFIDTCALLAKYLRNDPYHRKALPIWQRLSSQKRSYFVSTLVLSEACTILGRRSSHEFASERISHIYASPEFDVLRPDEKDELKALHLFKKYGDQRVSLADCISFVLMRKHRIPRAFTFDRHFRIAGFDVLDR